MRRHWKVAFVSPRYDPPAAGGAEVYAKLLAERLRDRGHLIEVLTTCADDHHTWENSREPGIEEVNGIRVRRFAVNPRRKIAEFLAIQERIGRGHRVSREDEVQWISGGVVSDDLNAHLVSHGDRYDCLVFLPYLFGVTYFGSRIRPEKTLLVPCLHDEPFAYLGIFKEMFTGARGVIFHTLPEMELAGRLYGLAKEKSFLVSLGFDTDGSYRPGDFRSARRLLGPYLLFAGRRERGKNVHLLLQYFRTFRRRRGSDLKLLLLGTGEVDLLPADRGSIVDLGYLPQREKLDAMAGCLALCQPSVNESLSIVIMETWLTRRPVLVHARCAVTRDHAERAHGGLYFEDYLTFEECLSYLLDHPGDAEKMGRNGEAYVRRNFSWEKILNRFEAALEQLFGHG